MEVTTGIEGTPPQAPPRRVEHGITAAELARRVPNRDKVHRLSPAELERWPLDFGLAERDGRPDLLVPTALALELALGLAP